MRQWTPNEVQYLQDNCGLISNRAIALKLGRTGGSIRGRLYRSHISIFDNFYSATLLGRELNRNKATVMQWYRKGWLKGKVADWGQGYRNPPMIFVEGDIVAFLKGHCELFQGHKIPNTYFKNVVVGTL
jgi:hypothetical protein